LLLRPLDPGFFFRKGLPVIPCDLGIPKWLGCSQSSRTIINNCGVLKQNLDVKHLIWKNIWNFADVRELGFARAAKNIVSFAVNGVFIPGTFGHLAFPHLKSTFDEIWQTCPRVMENTSRSRFRRDDGINHWLIGAWNMVSGRFYPANEKNRGALITVNAKNLSQICRIIRQQLLPEICLTDQEYNLELVQCFAEISGVFEELFPERSSFEKTL